MTEAAVHSKALALFMIHCLMFLTFDGCFVFGPRFVLHCLLSIISLRKRERRLLYFNCVLFLSCDCFCTVSIPHGAVGWSPVYHCDISWPFVCLF